MKTAEENIADFIRPEGTADLEILLNSWIGARRWFTGERKNPAAAITGIFGIAKQEDAFTALCNVRSGNTTYLVPLTFRKYPIATALLADNPQALLGEWAQGGEKYAVIDASEDPQGQIALLQTCFGETGPATAHPGEVGNISAQALRGGTAGLPGIEKIQPLRSEQSNTSIIYYFPAAPGAEHTSTNAPHEAGIILKLFRIAHCGANPDIELQQALDKTAPGLVPKQYGAAEMQLPTGTAAIMTAQEFIAGAKDAWQVFQEELALPSGKVADPAEIIALGRLTRDIHLVLAQIFPTAEVDGIVKENIYSTWINQAQKAVEKAPELEKYREKITEIFTAATQVPWPLRQRMHGDFHLGQVLNAPGRGWVALDFEGEPLRSLAERTAPGLALRDVAGMLRSFSYAAGAAELAGRPSTATGPWEQEATQLFIQGYGALAEREQILLRALLLEKALYEVVYEATYRPRWLPIPIRGIQKLLNNP